ncbi:MAG: metalloregulator ArsR/SmtB family transcription factor [Gemmatimonadota bacterium]
MNTTTNRRGLPAAELARRFQALADEKRLRILDILRDGEHCVCDLTAALDVAQSLLSFHLKTLKDAGLVSDRREGRWVHYSLVPEAVGEMEEVLGGLRADGLTCEGTTGSCCS